MHYSLQLEMLREVCLHKWRDQVSSDGGMLLASQRSALLPAPSLINRINLCLRFFRHVDLYYEDGGNPTEAILQVEEYDNLPVIHPFTFFLYLISLSPITLLSAHIKQMLAVVLYAPLNHFLDHCTSYIA